MRLWSGFFFTSFAVLLICAKGFGQSTPIEHLPIEQLLQQLNQVRSFSSPSISPDGRWVTWTISSAGNARPKEMFLLDRSNISAKPMRIEVPGANDASSTHSAAWSPDSRHVAFLSDSGPSSQDQIFVLTVGENEVRKLTAVNGYITNLRWSPDGKAIAFLYAENGGGGGPLEAAAAQLGEIGESLHNQRLTLIDANGGDIRQLSPAELNIYEYDWSPDGKKFAAIAAPGPADNNWWVAKLYTVSAESGKMQILYSPPVERQLAIPRWSPDSNGVAFIGGLMSDEGFIGGDIFIANATGGEQPKDVTAGKRFSASSLQWKSKEQLLFTAFVDGGGEIATLSLETGQIEAIWKGSENLHAGGNNPNLAVAQDGTSSVAIRSSWQDPPELWTGAVGDWKKATTVNNQQQARWGKAESIVWNNGPFRAQGWLLYPQNFDPGKHYPMIVSIHGGPSSERSASWPTAHFDMSVMAGSGYFVFFPNPRGSYGEGEAFTRANVKDFGGGDLKDILAGVDTVLKKAPVDPDRIGVTGWSYGGFMTMWTVTQTNRFHAAVAGAGVANWLSYYGENLIDEWMIPFFGRSVYEDPAVYAKSSPISYIKRVKTPTLIVVGERDAECPAPQSFEFWHALKTLGVPTKLVVYPGEGHAFQSPKNNLDVLRRTAEWFEKYLGAESSAAHTEP